MDSARFLILGAGGQVGLALAEHYPEAQKADRSKLDITDKASVEAYDWSTVDVILNAAAYTNVDGAETAEGRIAAWQANAQAAGYLAHVAQKHNITLVHISSEYVFGGTHAPHIEDESFSPLGVYGQSKAAGDIAVSTADKQYTLRTSWVIGDGKNFVRTMISLAERNISPSVVGDQIGRLTFTTTLVEAIDHLLTSQSPYGTYNVSNDGEPASWADVTRAIFTELGRTDLIVTNVTTAEYFAGKDGIAPRPLQSALDLRKIKDSGLTLRDWHDDLHTYIANQTKE